MKRTFSTGAPPQLILHPRPDVFARPARGLGRHERRLAAPGRFPLWFFLGAHGGSGASLIAHLSQQLHDNALRILGDPTLAPAYGGNAGHLWPDPALEPTPHVVVVCQTTARGLAWARDVAVQYLAGCAPAGSRLAGVLTIADQPGRLPASLASSAALLGGVYAHTWRLPYVDDFRHYTGLPGDPCPPIGPSLSGVLTDIRTTITTLNGDPA